MKRLFLILLGLAAATVAAARQTYTLENDRMRAEIDLASGALVGMQSKLTGWKMLENAAVGRAFEANVKLADGRFYVINESSQERPEVKISGNELTFVWNGLKAGSEKLDIGFQGRISLTDDGLVKQFETYNNGVVGFEYQSGNMDIALFANVLNHKIHQTDEFTFISNFIFSRSLSAVAYEGVQQPEDPEPDNPDPKPDPKPGDSGTTDPKPTTPPETGDSSNVMLWVALAVISCGMIPAAVVVLKRKAR